MKYKEVIEDYIDLLNSIRPLNLPEIDYTFEVISREIGNTIFVQVDCVTVEGKALFAYRKNFEGIKQLQDKDRNEIWRQVYKDLVRYSILGGETNVSPISRPDNCIQSIGFKNILTQKYKEDASNIIT